MPTYDYLCPNGHRFEVIHSVIADGPTSCPICGAAPVRKAFSAPSIHFKGTGWAKKDRSTSRRSTAASSTTSDGDTATTNSSGPDSATGSDAGSERLGGAGKDGGSGSDRGSSPDKGSARDATPGGDKPSSTDKGSQPGSSTGDAKAGG